MKIQVLAHTSFLGHTGYNNHSKNFFTNLNKYIPTRVRNYSYCDDLSYLKPEELALVIEQEWKDPPYKIGTPFTKDPQATLVNIVLNESHHYFFYDNYESPMIAYNVWEASRQLPEYFNRILEYDQFWCPTEWQRQCTIDQGYPAEKVKVVPEGVNGNIFKPCDVSNPLMDKKKFREKHGIGYETFVFMIFGRWDYRKSTTEMVQAFTEEFKNDEDVILLISADNPFAPDGRKKSEDLLKYYKIETDKIKVVHFPPREDYVKFLQHGDALLSCSRSEGWNLPLMEALACGTPSIASNWGGHLEFADGIAHLVDVPKELPPKDVFLFPDTSQFGVWGEPDFDHFKSVMRDVYSNYGKYKEESLKRSKYIRQLYSWDNAARKGEKYIKELVSTYQVQVPVNIDNKKFDIEFGKTDEGFIKVTFEPLDHYDRVLTRVRNSLGDILYQNWFEDLEPGISYWIAANHPVENLKSALFEILDEKNIIIQSDKKSYIRNPPKVSLVTTFYNAEKYIDELASSIFDQTFKDWEWIITDDWSEDNTKEKLLELARKDIRIKYIDQKFKQEIYWNPHKYAIGEIVCTIDADDALVPKTVEVISHFYNKYPKVNCIHTSGNYYLEEFNNSNFKNALYCRMDKYDSVLQKHPVYLKNDSGYERLGSMFGVIRSYRNPGPDFNFNDANYQLGKHEDLVKLLRMEEEGMPMFLNRHLYKIRLRESGSNSGNWEDKGVRENEFEKMRNVADKRRKTCYKHFNKYDAVRENLYAFLYSKLNEEKERKTISCLGFNLNNKDQQLIKDIYFDHKILFEEINIDVDYVFSICKSQNDIEMFYEITKDLRKAQVILFFINDDWTPDFYNQKGEGYFKFFEDCKNWLVTKRSFMWTTYLYKYCSIIFDVERKPKKLNLGCGNDIKDGYINIDKFNNTKNIDLNCDLGSLPFKDKEIDEIYLSHVFEHISINKMYSTIEEWRRVLKPYGDLIIIIPNLEFEVNAWLDIEDDKKWSSLHLIFGTQSHLGNSHFCGFNKGSLKSFIERFDFEVVEIKDQNRGARPEIYMHAKKKSEEKRHRAHYICHFVDGPYLELRTPKTKNFFVADFLDPDNNSSVHEQDLTPGTWTRPHRKYFTNWLVQVKRNGVIDFEHKFNAKDKNILISFDTKSIGDTIAWIPAAEEFRKKHQCKVYLSTFWNKLFDKCDEYKNITFVPPGDVVHNLYASYTVGCFDDDLNKNKINWRLVPLQKVAFDFLGIDYEKEIVTNIVTQTGRKRVTPDPYVAISEFSTFQCKFWNYPNGWQEIVDYLNEMGYKVVVVSKEKTNLKNIIDRTGRTMPETINIIKESEFFMGVSSGPSWIAWALKKPVILISGFSSKWSEFKTKVQRVINEDVCNSCFNDPSNKFERGEWNWCPRHKGTSRQFECTKLITPEMVKYSIDQIVQKKYSLID